MYSIINSKENHEQTMARWKKQKFLKKKKIKSDVEDYVNNQIQNSTIYQNAKSEGWHEEYIHYIRECAMIQSQIINQSKNGIAWQCNHLGYGTWNKNVLKTLEENISQAKTSNVIGVLIPIEALEYWKYKYQKIEKDDVPKF